MEDLDVYETWLAFGQKKGWISEVVCETHDGAPLTEAEFEAFGEADDPCIFIVRVHAVH